VKLFFGNPKGLFFPKSRWWKKKMAAAAARRLSPSTGFYTGLAILPIGRTLVDNPTADMRPAFGSPIPVCAKVDADSNGTFVDFYHAIAVLNEVGNKLEHFQRCYLHHSQVVFAPLFGCSIFYPVMKCCIFCSKIHT
jgi:hypothetical protein